MNEEALKSLDDIAISAKFSLEELLDGPALAEVARSFEALFGVALRVYSSSGALLADSEAVPELYNLLSEHKEGRREVQRLVAQVRATSPKKGETVWVNVIPGVRYLVSAICHDGRVLGKSILGPFAEPSEVELPKNLALLVPSTANLDEAWRKLPRLSQEHARKLDEHLRATIDLLVFSGLKAFLASSMHMASVKESFRELSDKNRKLQQAYDRLKELDRLKSNFLATVSHELRTPLTSIIGYSEMMLEGISGELNEEQREFLDTIHEKGEQLLELIKSLLDLSKLESGTMSLRKAQVDCGALVQQVVKTLTPAALKRGVSLVADVECELPSLMADGDRLRQVLTNLSENALKFTPAGGLVTVSARKVLLRSKDLDGVGGVVMAAATRLAIELRVCDTGIGIPERERDRVFDAFYQVDSSSTREVGGTGLGLSIVKRLVDAHDGRVHVEPNEPGGTIFVVTLPILHRS